MIDFLPIQISRGTCKMTDENLDETAKNENEGDEVVKEETSKNPYKLPTKNLLSPYNIPLFEEMKEAQKYFAWEKAQAEKVKGQQNDTLKDEKSSTWVERKQAEKSKNDGNDLPNL